MYKGRVLQRVANKIKNQKGGGKLAFIREKDRARVKRKREREINITAPVCRLRKMSVLYLAGYTTHSILFYFFVFRGDWGDVQISVLLFFFLFPS